MISGSGRSCFADQKNIEMYPQIYYSVKNLYKTDDGEE
jgi:hypothetical protein